MIADGKQAPNILYVQGNPRFIQCPPVEIGDFQRVVIEVLKKIGDDFGGDFLNNIIQFTTFKFVAAVTTHC